MGGPNHGILDPSGTSVSACLRAARPVAQRASTSSRGSRGQLVGAGVDEAVRVRDGAEHDLVPGGLVVVAAERVRGQHGHLVGPEQMCDGGGDGPALGGGVPAPAVLAQAVDGRAELVALGREVVEQACQQVAHAAASRASSRVRAHWSRIRARRRVSSVMVPASPRPRTRSRVACTSSRTPGRDSSAPSSSTVSRCVSRPDPLLQRGDRGQQRLVGAGGDPELERRGEDRRGEVVAEHPQDRPRALRPGGQLAGGGRELGPPHLGQVLDRGDDQVVLGREVVQLGTPAHPGPLAHQGRRRTAEAALDQQLDGGLQEAGPHRPGALLLRDARGGLGHPVQDGARITNSQD